MPAINLGILISCSVSHLSKKKQLRVKIVDLGPGRGRAAIKAGIAQVIVKAADRTVGTNQPPVNHGKQGMIHAAEKTVNPGKVFFKQPGITDMINLGKGNSFFDTFLFDFNWRTPTCL